jgi:hypothetical protein
VFYIGLGNPFDGDKGVTYPSGRIIVLPSDMSHFHWAWCGEYTTQVTAVGPLASNTWIPPTTRVSKIATIRCVNKLCPGDIAMSKIVVVTRASASVIRRAHLLLCRRYDVQIEMLYERCGENPPNAAARG